MSEKETLLPFFQIKPSAATALFRRLKRSGTTGLTDGDARNQVAAASPVERAALFFFALHPELTDESGAEAIARAIIAAKSPKNAGDADEPLRLMRLYCAAAKKNPAFAAKTDEFENLLNDASDCRLGGAVLSEIDDAFYADGFVKAVSPDWSRTTRDALVLPPVSGLRDAAERPFSETTAKALIRAVVLMILRDGFAAVPTAAVCRADENGTLWFAAPPFHAVLNGAERRFAAAIAVAVLKKDDRKIASALLASGFAPPLFPARDLSDLLNESADFAPADRLAFIMKKLTGNGFDPPFSLRCAVFALIAANDLCPPEHRRAAWRSAATDLADFADKGLELPESDDAERFRLAFGLADGQAERLELRGRKAAAFQNDFAALKPLLKSNTIAARLTAKSGAFKKIAPFALIVGTALIARFWIIGKAG